MLLAKTPSGSVVRLFLSKPIDLKTRTKLRAHPPATHMRTKAKGRARVSSVRERNVCLENVRRQTCQLVVVEVNLPADTHGVTRASGKPQSQHVAAFGLLLLLTCACMTRPHLTTHAGRPLTSHRHAHARHRAWACGAQWQERSRHLCHAVKHACRERLDAVPPEVYDAAAVRARPGTRQDAVAALVKQAVAKGRDILRSSRAHARHCQHRPAAHVSLHAHTQSHQSAHSARARKHSSPVRGTTRRQGTCSPILRQQGPPRRPVWSLAGHLPWDEDTTVGKWIGSFPPKLNFWRKQLNFRLSP